MMISSSIRDALEFIRFIQPDPTLQGRAARVATATATGEDREEGCNMWKWNDIEFKKIIPKYTNSDRHRREIELDACYPQILDPPKFSKYKSEYDFHLPHKQAFLAIPCMCVHETDMTSIWRILLLCCKGNSSRNRCSYPLAGTGL